ncbi:MAG: hypothetical protein COB51_09415 [Moraxellaceae bacterium]|nr:MAG: hypothetical protein COB51_09415 [Moraxellaceae bacterium]
MNKIQTIGALADKWRAKILRAAVLAGLIYTGFFIYFTASSITPNTDNKTFNITSLVERIAGVKDYEMLTSTFRDYASEEEIATLEEKNRQHLQVFLEDGWTVVESEPHDPALMALDPALLAERETELRQQLETTRVSEESIQNAADIALNAQEHRTRMAAIESIGHRRYSEGGEYLMTIFETSSDASERSKALGFVYLDSLNSTEADWAIGQLYNTQVTTDLSKQIANKLLLAGMVENNGDRSFIPSLMERIPEQSQLAIEELLAYTRDRNLID